MSLNKSHEEGTTNSTLTSLRDNFRSDTSHNNSKPLVKLSQKQDARMKKPESANSFPPDALIKTWMWMAYVSQDEEVKYLGKNNLTSSFGSLKAAVTYMESRSGK
jgi:hypothetical protein